MKMKEERKKKRKEKKRERRKEKGIKEEKNERKGGPYGAGACLGFDVRVGCIWFIDLVAKVGSVGVGHRWVRSKDVPSKLLAACSLLAFNSMRHRNCARQHTIRSRVTTSRESTKGTKR